MRLNRLFPFALVCLLFLLVACSGDDNNSGEANASNSSGSGGTTTTDLNEVAANVEELESFEFDLSFQSDFGDADLAGIFDSIVGLDEEFDLTSVLPFLGFLGDVSLEGAFAAPDKARFTADFGGDAFEVIVIGDRAWVRSDGGDWMEQDLAELELGLNKGPLDLGKGEPLPDDILSHADSREEDVNGVSATRYTFHKDDLVELAQGEDVTFDASLVEKADIDLWLSDEGIPVRVRADFEGKDRRDEEFNFEVEFNISNINEDVDIEAPQ